MADTTDDAEDAGLFVEDILLCCVDPIDPQGATLNGHGDATNVPNFTSIP